METNLENSISTTNLSIGYKNNAILENLNLNANSGNLIALIGVNGSGKSTLLRTLLKLQKPLEGNIFINKKPLEQYSLSQLAKTISYVSTEIITVQNLSVYNLVSLGRFPYTNWLGKLNSEDEKIVANSLDLVDMIKFKDKNINEISDGERQRVLIARTLAQDTPIILLDEPSSFLDLPNKFETIHLLHQLSKEKNKTIIFSTHDLNIAIQEADIFWLINNKMISTGTPEDLILNGEFSDIFKNSKLDFNTNNGEFGIKREKGKNIKVAGDGKAVLWTKKALERLGYHINLPDKEPVANITVSEINSKFIWEIRKNKNIIKTESIEQLVEILN